jgi:putative addiction module component (TIGR02574 family)
MAVDKVLQEALALPPEDRDRLLVALARSLEPDTTEGWERAWTAEIERRLRDLDEGRTTTISHEEFLRRMRAALSRP